MTSERVILDACCSLNLYATRQMQGILEALPYEFVIGARARAEAQWLKTGTPGEREAIDLLPLLQAGLLVEQALEGSPEMALFVDFGAFMEEGEAEAAALALQRGFSLATDERKVRRVLAAKYPTLKLLSTVDLLLEWQFQSGLSDQAFGLVLKQVTVRATFLPPPSDPRRSRWLQLIQE